MLVLAGLGNPGKNYSNNRHNVGFIVIDELAKNLEFPDFCQKFNGMFSMKSINGEKILLIKPMTYMNLSGNAIAPIFQFFKLQPTNLCVIHDDLDLSEFRIKMKNGGGDAGHNGLTHITKTIGRDYFRIRIGIGRPEFKEQVKDYVLSDFSDTDGLQNCIKEVIFQIKKDFLKNLN